MTGSPSRRHDARERALGLLYEAYAKDTAPAAVLAALPVEPDEYAAALVAGVGEHAAGIDSLIAQYARGWAVDRMAVIDRTILRVAVFELAHRPDVPTAVVIDEAVGLAKEFSTDDSGRFVNGVLGPIAGAVRPDAQPVSVAALIVDVDGVVRHWDGVETAALEDRLGVPRGSIRAVAFEPSLVRRSLTGELTDSAWREAVGLGVAEAHGVDAAAVTAGWQGTGGRIDADVVALLAAVRAEGRCRVALFSNATDRLEDDLVACGVADEVDEILNSSRLGLVKPDVEAFVAAADRLGVAPGRCLFVDDTAENVEGARAAGMRAEVYVDVAGLRTLLVETGLLP